MTEQEIKQKGETSADKLYPQLEDMSCREHYISGYIAGAHSRDEEKISVYVGQQYDLNIHRIIGEKQRICEVTYSNKLDLYHILDVVSFNNIFGTVNLK